ncbi:hypothetical protein BJY04DRAFT_210097 [Aspergillus karnatakaensis]|uniref:uncharacterized protein n=1 Tax=Aspergillus karnatakaensis TaxID=1810916 RepID=UPI003CCD53A7
MLATTPHCVPPGVSGFALPQLKRKRSDSGDSTTARDAPVATKLRTDDALPAQISLQQRPSALKAETSSLPAESRNPERIQELQSSIPGEDNSDPPAPGRNSDKAATRKVDVERLRETLEAQLSLEVLLKHNELRLIDQEIAKCQVALEQLRRCAEIPYPGSQATGPSQSVSGGRGISVWGPGNGPAPLSPAPWGVVDGPYTRHYSKWLLPDPRFDGGELEPATPMGMGVTTPMEGRSTRGNPIDTVYLAGKTTRPQRGSTGMKLQSLPSGYPAPKERAGPMIIRRKSDNVLVKLVCLDCRRDNFSSTQGFINHCRIAHNRNFASHDAAAVASGEPVEVDDAGAVVGGKNEPATSLTPGFVHPLIRSAHTIESTNKSPASDSEAARRQSPQSRGLSTTETPRTPGPRTPITKAANGAFIASEDTPHLSSLMKLRGVGLDLDQLVGEAKTAVDFDGYSSEEGESETEPTTPSAVVKTNKPLATRAGRQPMRTTVSQTASERPDGHKGVERPTPRPFTLETLTPTRPVPYQSPYAPTGTQVNDLRDVVDLSPHTVESNQAPSLVSDDDDFEAASDSDPDPSSSEAEDGADEFSMIDVGDDEDTTGSTTTSDSNPKADVGLGSAAKPLQRGNIRKKGQYINSSVVPMSRGKGSKDEKRTLHHNALKRLTQPTKMPITLPSKSELDLNPKTITLSTFHTLLGRYEDTVRELTRRRALAKVTKGNKKDNKAKDEKKGKGKGKNKRTLKHDGEQNEEEEGTKGISKEVQNRVKEQVQEFWELDCWRYTGLREMIEARQTESSDNGVGNGKAKGKGSATWQAKGAYLSKEEVIKLMEWKLKHGVNRPTLLGLLRTNQDRTIQSATSSAFSTLQSLSSEKTSHADYDLTNKSTNAKYYPVQKSLNELTTPIRGIGPATASLLLSAATPTSISPPSEGIPFYSDDTYLWLNLFIFPAPPPDVPILGDESAATGAKEEEGGGKKHKHKEKLNKKIRPNGELIVKYNIAEYKALWEAVEKLRRRLNEEAREGGEEGKVVSCNDLEKVALVVRHLELAGLVEKNEEGNAEAEAQGEFEVVEEGDGFVVEGKRKKRKVDAE